MKPVEYTSFEHIYQAGAWSPGVADFAVVAYPAVGIIAVPVLGNSLLRRTEIRRVTKLNWSAVKTLNAGVHHFSTPINIASL